MKNVDLFTTVGMILHWRKSFDLYTPDTLEYLSQEKLNNAFRLIEEEYTELKQDIEFGTRAQIVEESIDLIWVVLQLLFEMGVDVDEATRLKYEANMSKMIPTTNENELKPNQHYEVLTNGMIVIKHSITGKIQKPSNYKKADFSKFD